MTPTFPPFNTGVLLNSRWRLLRISPGSHVLIWKDRSQNEIENDAHGCTKQVAQTGVYKDASCQRAGEERRRSKEQTHHYADQPGNTGREIQTGRVVVSTCLSRVIQAPGIIAPAPDHIDQEDPRPDCEPVSQ